MSDIRKIIPMLVVVLALYGIFRVFFIPSAEELPGPEKPLEFYSTDLGDNLRTIYLSAIDGAKESIDIVIYTIKDPAIIRALNRRAEQGIPVTLVYDDKASSETASQLSPKIKAIPRAGEGITHQKIVVVDRKLVLLGTANLTSASLRYWGNLVSGMENPKMGAWLSQYIRNLGRIRTGSGGGEQTFNLPPKARVILTPDQGAVGELRSLIRSAKKTIRVAMFTWTRLDLVSEIVAAKRRGVDVQVVLDTDSSEGVSGEVFEALKEGGIPVYLYKSNHLLHYKTAIIDGEILINGSANWTLSAFRKNDDCLIVFWGIDPDFLERFWKAIKAQSREAA